jgi:hypothetical protein
MQIRRFSDIPEIDSDEGAKQAQAIKRQIRPHLAGLPSEVQGAILADLLSLWLAGHIVPGNRRETDSLRSVLLRQHVKAVREMIPSSEAEILGNLPVAGSG